MLKKALTVAFVCLLWVMNVMPAHANDYVLSVGDAESCFDVQEEVAIVNPSPTESVSVYIKTPQEQLFLNLQPNTPYIERYFAPQSYVLVRNNSQFGEVEVYCD